MMTRKGNITQPGVTLTVAGSGDAFGSGGRMNTCFLVEGGGHRFLIDCGATSMVGLKRLGVPSASVAEVVCTHLHGDHIGGLPFFLREPRIAAPRSEDLVVAGPPGIDARVRTLTEAMFPAFPAAPGEPPPPLPVRFVELDAGVATAVGPLTVVAFPVVHTPGSNPHALRVEFLGVTIAYTGDTEWVPVLPELAEGADLLIAEGYSLTPKRAHLDLETLRRRRSELRCRRLLLTHPGEDVLREMGSLDFEYAHDGMVVEIPSPQGGDESVP